MMLSWAVGPGLTIEAEDMAQVNRMENPDDVEAFYGTRAQIWEEERRAEGRAEGRSRGTAGVVAQARCDEVRGGDR